MKQYKHIPTGDIWKECKAPAYKGLIHDKEGNKLSLEYTTGKDWEEIKKPEWTILSFREASLMSLDEETGLYSWSKQDKNAGHGHKAEFLLAKKWPIHSVRRESDGEVFTVGDNTNIGQITAFEIRFNFMEATVKMSEGLGAGSLPELKKVKPKEWEIINYHAKKTGKILKPTDFDINDDINHEDSLEIYSVKRLFDGVEFKIGGKIKSKNYGSVTIQGFGIVDDALYVKANGTLSIFLENVVKMEKLFTTEDGVDIYDKDKYFRVNTKSWELNEATAFTKYKDTHPFYYKENKEFSNKEEAEEYILMNKPCLSIKDLINNFELAAPNSKGKTSDWFNSIPLDKLRELAKTKL